MFHVIRFISKMNVAFHFTMLRIVDPKCFYLRLAHFVIQALNHEAPDTLGKDLTKAPAFYAGTYVTNWRKNEKFKMWVCCTLFSAHKFGTLIFTSPKAGYIKVKDVTICFEFKEYDMLVFKSPKDVQDLVLTLHKEAVMTYQY